MDDRYDFQRTEGKWQARWDAEKTFRAADDGDRPRCYVLEMFPYPSGAGLSVGHCKNYGPADAFCRYKSMKGFSVLHPMGWDAFGQPAENEAIKRKRHPRDMVPEYAANYRRTLKLIGSSYDWDREINSSEPEYYRWTQWFFLLLYSRGLAYRATAPINWCPMCRTGLANEEAREGRCWRCDSVVEKRPMPQWYFRITAYADRLLADLDQLDWPEGIKLQQQEWIGRSEGADVTFPVVGSDRSIEVFTTRPDTLWGATFMVLAPEHPLVGELTAPSRRREVAEYIRRVQSSTEIERMAAERPKTGVFLGAHALNPVNGEHIPVWIADYVMMGYGTGAIMAVPAHDQRDFEFARKFGIPVELVYATDGGPATGDEMTFALPDGGRMREFETASGALTPKSPFAGLPNDKGTVRAVTEWLERFGVGRGRVNYRMKDWLISRQRYWGAPIPIVHCPGCGEVPVPESDLPVLLPQVDRYEPSGTGESPLATMPEFVSATCPRCGVAARRETDTMGGFACSSWYFLRFADPRNAGAFADRAKLDAWLPVDMYSGGAEHAVMHLLYARFWTKVMFDAGLVGFEEPFPSLRSQGAMLAWTPGRRPRANETPDGEDEGEQILDWVVLRPEELATFPQEDIIWRWVRMSKSKGNVVTPESMVDRYGADSLRVHIMFVAPFEANVEWRERGVEAAQRFLLRAWRWMVAALPRTVAHPDRLRGASLAAASAESRAMLRKLHKTIRKVDEDIARFRFNTAIAAVMELVNDLYLYCPPDGSARPPHPAVVAEALESLILLLAPFAPHMADEAWEGLGRAGSTYHARWPSWDADIAADEVITIGVQVNGKLKDRLDVAAGASDREVIDASLASPKIAAAVAGRTVRRSVVVPGRLINIIVD